MSVKNFLNIKTKQIIISILRFKLILLTTVEKEFRKRIKLIENIYKRIVFIGKTILLGARKDIIIKIFYLC